MAYMVYIDGLLLPIAPSKIETKIKGNNKEINLINEGDINVLKLPGLTEFSFDALLPNSRYPFAVTDTKPNVFLSKFESLMVSKRPFQFIVIRTKQNNEMMYATNIKVSLEEYKIKEDAKDGFDITVSLDLKQYKEYGTKTVNIIGNQGTKETPRSTENAPDAKTHKVVKGDCLWNLAKKYLGDGSRYPEIYELNKDIISNPNRIYVGQTLKLPT
jgi:LysM repeat protein